MADTKITALAAIGANPINVATFPIPMVDLVDTSMAASGTTKKVTVNQILGAGGTATLASATISGDLTVDTSTLKVDSANNRVGIGTASPYSTAESLNARTTALTSGSAFQTMPLTVTDSTAYAVGVGGGINFRAKLDPTTYENYAAIWSYRESANNSDYRGSLIIGTSDNTYGYPIERYRIASDGVATWSNVGGVAGTAMTLNSTGLGVGASSNAKLTIASANTATASWGIASIYSTDAMAVDKGGSLVFGGSFTGSTATYFAQIAGRKENSTDADVAGYLAFSTRPTGGLTTERLRIDSAGNVGIGVTPSAWTASYSTLNIGSGGSISTYKTANYDQLTFGCNHFENTSGAWRFINNGYATQYWHNSGSHVWRISTTNNAAGANQPLTWTQAMTLESTGSLVLGAAAVATTATDGFLYIPGCAGTPTGTPTAKTGRVPLVVDTTNNKLYFYSGGAWVAAN